MIDYYYTSAILSTDLSAIDISAIPTSYNYSATFDDKIYFKTIICGVDNE